VSDEFNYFADEHYSFKVVSGGEGACMTIFEAEIKQYPNMVYGTRIVYKSLTGNGGPYKIVICRFKTPELCRKHTEYPPTYIREGKVL